MFSKTMPLKLARNSNPDCATKANLKDFFKIIPFQFLFINQTKLRDNSC